MSGLKKALIAGGIIAVGAVTGVYHGLNAGDPYNNVIITKKDKSLFPGDTSIEGDIFIKNSKGILTQYQRAFRIPSKRASKIPNIDGVCNFTTHGMYIYAPPPVDAAVVTLPIDTAKCRVLTAKEKAGVAAARPDVKTKSRVDALDQFGNGIIPPSP